MNGLHGIIFAYEKTPGLRELTEERMPGSVPFGGRYRAIDFMLSNMHNAGITGRRTFSRRFSASWG